MVLDTNEAAQKLFFAGLGGMCQITDADLVKKKFQRVTIETKE